MAPMIRQIGGRAWRTVDSRSLTLEHDGQIERAIRRAGLHTLKREPVESVEQFMVRIYTAVVDNDQSMTLLSALLLPEEVPDDHWTPARAHETVQFLRPLTATEDKMQMRLALISFLADFFADGLLCAAPSPTALQGSGQPAEKASGSAITS